MARTNITGRQIADTTVATIDLADGSITATKLGTGAIIGVDIQPFSTVLASIGSLVTTGFVSITNGGTSRTISTRSLVGTSNEIAVINGDGAAGNPTVSLVDNPILPGLDGVTLPSGATGDRGTAVNGKIRYNTSTGLFEGVVNSVWTNFLQNSAISAPAALQVRKINATTAKTTATSIAFDTTDLVSDETQLYHSTSNIDRCYVTSSGYYMLCFSSVITDTSSNTTHTVSLQTNGTTTIAGSTNNAIVNANNKSNDLWSQALVYLNAGDYVRVMYSKNVSGGTSTLSSGCTLTISKLTSSVQGPPGAMGGNNNLVFYPSMVDTPTTNGDWVISAGAPAISDPTYKALVVRAFDDTTEEGIGFNYTIPPTATTVTFSFKCRASSAQSAANKAALISLYYRSLTNNSAPSTWSSRQAITTLSFGISPTVYYATIAMSLASLSIVPGTFYQFELTRNASAITDTLIGDLLIYEIGVNFS